MEIQEQRRSEAANDSILAPRNGRVKPHRDGSPRRPGRGGRQQHGSVWHWKQTDIWYGGDVGRQAEIDAVQRQIVLLRRRVSELEPAPQRKRVSSWRALLKAYWGTLAAADFFTTEVWTPRGLITFYVLFVIDLATRRVQIGGIHNPARRSLHDAVARELTGFDAFWLASPIYCWTATRSTRHSFAAFCGTLVSRPCCCPPAVRMLTRTPSVLCGRSRKSASVV